MVPAMMPACALQRGFHFIQADAAVAILVQLGEDIIGLRDIRSTRAERVLEFGLADLAVAIGIDLREQILQCVGRTSG